jgi:hypothetical protein
MAAKTCPRCGMSENQWKGNNGRGVDKRARLIVVMVVQTIAVVPVTEVICS